MEHWIGNRRNDRTWNRVPTATGGREGASGARCLLLPVIMVSSGESSHTRVGVSDGFRNTSDPQPHQQDQLLSSAECGKTGQIVRESATSRNQAAKGNNDPES